MTKKPLKVLFEAMYHEKYSFDEFINTNIETEYKENTIQSKHRERKVHQTTKKLKTFLSFLSLFVFEYLEINPRVVFSYRKGFNALDAVSKHAQNSYFYQTDIADFFPSLNRSIVRKTITNGIPNSPAEDAASYIDRILELSTLNNALPLGFSSSPILSNACLLEFDNALEDYCVKQGMVYTRYSDDLIVSAQNIDNLAEIDTIIKEILKEKFENQLHINDSKSKLTRKGNKIKLLGLVILPTGKVTIDIKIKNEIETYLHYYTNNRVKFLELDKINGDLAAGIDVVFGLLNYANTIDKDYLDKLRKKYGATVVDMLLRKPGK